MNLLFVADGRSPIARGWIQPFIEAGDEVHLVSTFACQPPAGLASFDTISVAFSGFKRSGHGSGGGAGGIGLRTRIRQYLGPLTLPRAARQLRQTIARLSPDLVHALRVPYEGMAASAAEAKLPLIISTWGNDFTLHAESTPWMRRLTQQAMAAADGLHTDCQRDMRLAQQWGFNPRRPSIVLPGNGGLPPIFLQSEAPVLPPESPLIPLLAQIGPEAPVVVNPRGFRAYVRNDTFFRSIPLVLKQVPSVVFVCPTMTGEPLAEAWRAEYGLQANVELLGRLDQSEMAQLLRRAQLVVSPSEHDGTPNSLLEAMASGAVPVAGDLESIREWIQDGKNGRLIDPADPNALAEAIIGSLQDDGWRSQASKQNRELVKRRASRPLVFAQARAFYQQVQQSGPML